MIRYHQIPNKIASELIDNIVFRGRILWRDLATWLNAYLIAKSFQSNAELEAQIINKLLNAPEDFANMLKVFFGDQVANDFSILLTNYINLLINLIDAKIYNDVNAVNEYTKQIYENNEQRAEFLSEINPFWDKRILLEHSNRFNNMMIKEIDTFIAKQYQESAEIFDKILSYTSTMGDYSAHGITDYLTYSLG